MYSLYCAGMARTGSFVYWKLQGNKKLFSMLVHDNMTNRYHIEFGGPDQDTAYRRMPTVQAR